MTIFTLALVVLAGALVVGFVFAWAAHRRRAKWNARRVAALASVAERIDAAVASLGEMTVIRSFDAPRAPAGPAAAPPLVGDGLPGRAALVDAAAARVAEARADGSRLAAAIVRTTGEGSAGSLAHEVSAVVDVPAYAVGTRAVAILLPGLGRADALGVLARVEAQCASSGRAVELEPGEDGVELVARLLGQGAPPGRTV